MVDHLGERAVVLGAGIAGLLASRVLSNRYREVLIVERDEIIGVTGTRRGIPQGSHAHALLAKGQQILEDFFPGLLKEMQDDGVPIGDMAGRLRWYFNGARLAQQDCGLLSVSATRPQLEAYIRDRVSALPNVEILQSTVIRGLVISGDKTRIKGVRVAGAAAGTDEVITADLVVDATGRGSRTPAWLEEFGYERPAEDSIKIDLTYTSRNFTLTEDPFGNDLAINPVASPANPRGAFFVNLGNGEALVSLTGIIGDRPPGDLEGFLGYTRSLSAPEIHDAVHTAKPVGEATSFRVPASIRRRYDKLRRFPSGFLVIGDGVCAFNPVYGQGMTVAAMEAVALAGHLAKGQPRPVEFFREIKPIIDAPWSISAGGDLAFPEVVGKRNLQVRLGNMFMSRLHTAAQVGGRFTAAFFRVAGLVDPPQTLMRPGFMFDALRTARRVLKGRSARETGVGLSRATR
ncbi:FAD-dependent oxidoreductase [Amycolatopsis decaplanina]|uniref:FAD-binding monooxygenase n=1 Tax=Amycolatopsis decaplanina DSM 44594 TaxID=1284240 RepID=M2ZPM5_9PSEU|nr:FAD-dependent oxidoreductase [Amycolatopsis decaplanina]EME62768.1 FAD-binding monooxygenase [Amycolatopsis decaplanina DSM 44594]